MIRKLALAALLLATPALADEPGGLAKPPPPPVTGEQVYRQVCQSCHMADAKGGVGAAAIPGLASNPRLGVEAYPLYIVVNGKGAMPGFSDVLTPAQMANVTTYIRTHFGNRYRKPVTEADVAPFIQGSHSDH